MIPDIEADCAQFLVRTPTPTNLTFTTLKNITGWKKFLKKNRK
jgi:hypothetical protein